MKKVEKSVSRVVLKIYVKYIPVLFFFYNTYIVAQDLFGDRSEPWRILPLV